MTGDESPAFSPGSPEEEGIGQQVLLWAHQFRQCVDLMQGQHASLRKNSNVLLAILECTKLTANKQLAIDIENTRVHSEVATDINRRMHFQRKLGILRAKQGETQHRHILKTINFLENYVEQKFPISDNVTVKTLHVLAELKQGFSEMQANDRKEIVTSVLAAKPTFSASAYTMSRRNTSNAGSLADTHVIACCCITIRLRFVL